MIIRRIARPLLASIFVVEGFDALRHPGGRADVAEPVIDVVDRDVVQPAAQKVAAAASGAADHAAGTAAEVADDPEADSRVRDGARQAAEASRAAADQVRRASFAGIDLDDATYVRINGGVQLGAGLLLATGRAPRLASTALAASLVPTTLAGHRWWELEGEERRAQRIQFLKNLGMLGGLILAAIDTEGRPDLVWRARHRHDGRDAPTIDAAATTAAAVQGARHLAHSAREQASHLAEETAPARHDLAERAGVAAHHLAERAQELAPQVREVAHEARDRAVEAAPQIREAATELRDRAMERAPQLRDTASELRDRAVERAPQLRDAANELRDRAVERAPQLREAASELAPQAHALGARVGGSLASAART